MNKPLPW